MSKKRLIDSLQELNFSKNDAEVYLALVKLGTTTAGPIITETQFHRNVVYSSLDHLEKRRLVSVKTIRGRKRFSVSNPNLLAEDFSRKADIAQRLSKEIKKELTHSSQEITVHQGNEEFLSLLMSMMKLTKGEEVLVLGAGGEQFMEQTMLKIWDEYHNEVKRLKMKIRLLCYENQRDAIEPEIKGIKNYRVKYLSDEFENPAGLQIYPAANTVFNLIYPDETNPITVIKIVSESLSKGYENLFRNLWKIN